MKINSMSYFKMILSMNKIYYFLKVFLAIIQGVFPVFTALMPKFILDAIMVKQSREMFLFYVVSYIVLQAVISAIYSLIEITISQKLRKMHLQINEDFNKKLFSLNYAHFDDEETYNIIQRAKVFASNGGISVIDTVLSIVSTTITVVSYVYIVASFSPVVFVVIFLSIAINYIIMRKITEYNVKFQNDTTRESRKINYFSELLLNKFQNRDMRFNGTYDSYSKAFRNEFTQYANKSYKKDLKLFGLNQIAGLSQNGLTLCIMILFGLMLLQGEMTVGDYTVTLNTSLQFGGIMFTLIKLVTNMHGLLEENKNYIHFLNIIASDKTEQTVCAKPISMINLMEIDAVSYRYFGTDKNALNNVSCVFHSGKKYAVLGGNGSGKSTLLKIILGLYNPNVGSVKVNKKDMRLSNKSYFNQKTAVVFQDFQFIDGISYQENLCLDNEKKFKEYKRYAEILNAKNGFGLSLEFSKIFDAQGLEFSGGERQKIANIRAALKDAELVVFDEPSSALDTSSEKNLFSEIINEMNEKIVVFVTHSIDMAQYADEIIYLDDGNVIFHGDYEEFMKTYITE